MPGMIKLECVDQDLKLYDVWIDGKKIADRVPWVIALRLIDVDPKEAE